MSLFMGLFLASCNDDDVVINTTPIVDASSIATGSSEVTATTATLYGTVKGLESQEATRYAVGFFYGTDANNLSNRVNGELVASRAEGAAPTIVATITGLTEGTVMYYQAFVELQGRVTFRGEVSSLVTTDATVATAEPAAITSTKATLGGTQSGSPADATFGVVVAPVNDQEAVRAGVILPSAGSDIKVEAAGFRPNTTYYYAAFVNLGSGIIYGDVKSFTTQDYEFDLENDLVDLGLSVKWGRMNIAAEAPSEMGGLFGFGDLTGFKTSIDPADFASADTYRTHNDLAYEAYQGKVTLPTADDFEELFTKCTAEWTEMDGVAGYKLTGPNGNSIFLPAAGSRIINTTEGVGTMGNYLTGTVNANNSEYCLSYQFNASTKARATAAVYQAMSVRPVGTAKSVPFVLANFCQKWYLDNGQDGKQHVFQGPFTQFGRTDSWATITNGQPNADQQVYWEMGSDNGWIGYTYGKDYGYIEFKEDGTVTVSRNNDEGEPTVTEGHYTIDQKDIVLDIDIDVLAADTWLPTKSGKLNILSCTEDGLQIGLPTDDGYNYSLNYYSEAKRIKDDEIVVTLSTVGGDWGCVSDAVVGSLSPADLYGTHTAKWEGSNTSAMVVYLDFANMLNRIPDAAAFINEIKVDGEVLPFDGNRFFYGDIEGKGIYRVELFNIYGKGADASNKVVESPFSNNAAPMANDPTYSFTSSVEITYTIFDSSTTWPVTFITINKDWSGDWNYTGGATPLQIKPNDDFKLMPVQNEYDITLPADGIDYSAGPIMSFVEIKQIRGLFPAMHCALDEIYLDGTLKTGYDESKIVDATDSDPSAYRLELWNCYGATQNDCGFGERNGDTMPALGFSDSMRIKFSIQSLFATPW